jgi:hypothetical protein
MKTFFARSRHSHLLLSLYLVFFGPAEHCDLENFGSPWLAAAGVKAFLKQGKERVFFVDVR